jgi:hypothetical protein
VTKARAWIAVVSVLVLAVGIAAAVILLSDGDGDGEGREGEVVLSLEPGPAAADALLSESGALERAVATFNRELDLSTDLRVAVVARETAASEDVSSPLYEPREVTVYLPWSFVADAHRKLRALPPAARSGLSADELTVGAMEFVLFHELAHGVIDLLEIPVVGGEEPTADSLATVFAIASDSGSAVPLGGATLNRIDQGPAEPTEAEYAAEHDIDRERAYDALCLLYGSDPDRWAGLVGDRGLPESRAGSCEYDYQQELRGWRLLLDDALTEEGGLLPLER